MFIRGVRNWMENVIECIKPHHGPFFYSSFERDQTIDVGHTLHAPLFKLF